MSNANAVESTCTGPMSTKWVFAQIPSRLGSLRSDLVTRLAAVAGRNPNGVWRLEATSVCCRVFRATEVQTKAENSIDKLNPNMNRRQITSFQASKDLCAGEGGAVLTNDDRFAALCRGFHDQGRAPQSKGLTSLTPARAARTCACANSRAVSCWLR